MPRQSKTARCIFDMTENRYIVGENSMIAPKAEPALYLVATPIGHLADITLRALETLAGVDLIACEDTRVTRILLARYAIRKKTVSYHEHNAAEAGAKLIDILSAGKSVALVSDAGTPLISDPGFRLVEQAHAANIRVVPIPGAAAVITALVASGLPTDQFFFGGFLPAKSTARRKKLEGLKTLDASLVFYESPYRVVETLADMTEIFGSERQASLCRELTKTFETIHSATLAELSAFYRDENRPRGEIVLVIAPSDQETATFSASEINHMLLDLAQTMPAAKAAAEAAHLTGQKKQELYARLLSLKEK
ncbi:MAG: Tetrapyrrole methylase family protein [Candidatus Tokpelaia hoelldobleri]|uniref:Ribosomal RNA small subunit methyltransferase I n=1 Tax=Candidatus Tokpelaia hoelldobleri TaxID=1902579 RepID=A0A1U9JVD4_9HYPH|nr:MAG: Tetrapyrrole methylase family protein [Candidatus Tokpelaia hoelldoblerii]